MTCPLLSSMAPLWKTSDPKRCEFLVVSKEIQFCLSCLAVFDNLFLFFWIAVSSTSKASLYNGTSEFGEEFVPQIIEGFFSTKDKPREASCRK